MENERSTEDDFTELFKRKVDPNNKLMRQDLSTAALYTYVRTAAETTEELNNQLDIINAIKTPLTAAQTAEKADLKKSLATMKLMRKGLAARITEEKNDAQQRLLKAQGRFETAKSDTKTNKVFKQIKYFNKDAREKTISLTRRNLLKTARDAVQNEVDRLDELKKLTKKKTFLTTKRGALFGAEPQRIDPTKDIPIDKFAQRELLQDDRPMSVIGREVEKRAQGKSVPERPTRLAPRR